MKKLVLLLSLLSANSIALALNCDKTAASNVMQSMFKLGASGSAAGYQTFKWNNSTDTIDRNSLSRLMIAYADADACLSSSARDIRFYRNNKLEAVMQPGAGIRFIN